MILEIKLEINERDFEALSFKCFEHELTIPELFKSFLGDLLGSENAGGSDERMYADLWFRRRHSIFSTSAEKRFKEIYSEELEKLVTAWKESPTAFGYDVVNEYIQSKFRKDFINSHGFDPCDLIDEWLDNNCDKIDTDGFWTIEQEEKHFNDNQE